MEPSAFNHTPRSPYPREKHYKEIIYSQEWQKLMGTLIDDDNHYRVEPLSQVLSQMPSGISQRHATVAASFICWLGTNCGISLLSSFKRMADRCVHLTDADAYLAAWTLENRRRNWLNAGFTILEAMIGDIPSDTTRCPRSHLIGRYQSGPDDGEPWVTSEDMEVANNVVEWLAGIQGQAFLKVCLIKISTQMAVEAARTEVVREMALSHAESSITLMNGGAVRADV